MSYQDPSVSGEVPVYADWTETGTHATATVTVTHAAESGKSHYICGVAVSFDYAGAQPPGGGLVSIKDNVTGIIVYCIGGIGTKSVGTSGAGTGVATFPHPIKITEGNPLSVEADPLGTTTRVHCNVWGFTR